MSKKDRKGNQKDTHEPVIENRRARHDYAIEDTLECGMKLLGTEVKSIRDGQVSLAEGWVKATADPPRLTLHGVHVAEYPNASSAHQHDPVRVRTLLANKREIRKLANEAAEPGVSLVPLKIYFKHGVAKLLVGVGRGKRRSDKRQDLKKREARREIDRAMSRKL